jgi:regulatory protein
MAWAFMTAKTEPSLKARAMRFLARREHSREELARKLARVATEGEDIDAVLDDLASRGWLSDARFAEQVVRAKARRYGPLKVTNDLRAKGVEAATIAAAFSAAGADGAAQVESVWRSRFSTRPVNDRERARQVRFLQGRGFALDDILKFLKENPR